MCTDDEVLVGGHGVETGLRTDEVAGEGGNPLPQLADDFLNIGVVDFAIGGSGSALDWAAMDRNLDAAAGAVDCGKSVGGETTC